MTDSMKFGPEWLRNMSSDNSSSGFSSCNSGQNGSGAGGGSGNIQVNFSGNTIRGQFPEFRYGREEMLSLFDKNCILPDILPSFKKLFVEKVQYPLALTPSSEEELLSQGSQVSTQRPAWIRSPVGFNSSATRGGTGRGGSVDRGRIRGKSTYHSLYQRPTAVFEDEARTVPIKSERGWSERNGASEALGVSNNSSAVVGPEWNGTPSSSPRKDFSNHSRNMENWRKSRPDDGSGDVSNNNYTSAEGGWRNSGRWGRSTSWRDEENSAIESNSNVVGGGTNIIQRSQSTIATTVTERGNGYNSYSRSTSQNAGGGQSQVRVGTRSHWIPANSSNNMGRNVDGEDNLPEWAVENPSAGGGTFDSSGAFHGSVDKDETILDTSGKNGEELNDVSIEGVEQKNEDFEIVSCQAEVERCAPNDSEKSPEPIVQKFDEQTEEVQSDQDESVADEIGVPASDDSQCNKNNTQIKSPSISAFGNPAPNDYSDRMREVADDMIEKLIMEDDSNEKRVAIVSANPEINTSVQSQFPSPIIASILTQTNQNVNNSNSVAVSPTLPPVVTGHNSASLYGGVGVIDNSHIQQLELQRQHLPSSSITSSSSTSIHQTINTNDGTSEQNLWFYRDPQSKVQGPFTAIEMTEWYRAGYFNEILFVRRICDTRFRTLGDLIKLCNGNMPFTHSHLIPMCLDDIHISNIREKPQLLDDFILKQQQHIDEMSNGDLKDNAMNSHYQLIQDQYIHQEELKILAELSKFDFFKQLNSQERDILVRQKLNDRFPNYLRNLSGLSNPLENMNVIPPGHHLYDAIGELSKRDHGMFRVLTPQQQQVQCPPPTGNNFMDSNNFMMQALQQQVQQQQIQQPIAPIAASFVENMISGIATKTLPSDKMSDDVDNNILNDFNRRLLLRQQQKPQEFLNNVNVNDFLSAEHITQQQQPQQHPIMHMWLPHVDNGGAGSGSGVAGTASASNLNQTQMLNQKLQQHHTHLQPPDHGNQWAGGPLVGIMATSPIVMGSMPVQPANMWDCSTLEQVQSQQQQQRQQTQLEQQHNLNCEHDNLKEDQLQIVKQQQSDEEHERNVHAAISNDAENPIEMESINPHQYQTQKSVLSEATLMKQSKDDPHSELKQQTSLNKRNSSNNNVKQNSIIVKTKDEGPIYKRNEDERRRDGVEEKRRLKEEKKRQLVEEEKRRLQQIEDEKRRLMLEEKERQQQIQAQRRRALLGNDSPISGVLSQTINTMSTSSTSLHKQQNKDQQKIFSSIAPWSIHNNASVNQTGPSLAEIQKAERRERRADQQRQIELMEKQTRSNVANNESNDPILTWNAAPLPVKSFAEIQAEEAKRLANQQLETQRRKEQELLSFANSNNTSGVSTVGGGNSSSSSNNVANIWGANKVWSSSTTPTGFWEEPIKFNSSLSGNVAKQKTANPSNLGSLSSTQLLSGTNRANLKKSQTVSVMQKGNSSIQQLQSAPSTVSKSNVNTKIAQVKNRSNTSITTSINKKDELENEFTMWCIRSLNHVTDKVDIPTFVTFLRDLESPYEVKDYIRYYLGENKEFADFGKQFLEKRSKYKNLQRAQNAHNDDMCKPAPAITPTSLNDDSKGKQKKLKKSKMTKLDARILGFSVTAAEGRINVGDRDYVDAP